MRTIAVVAACLACTGCARRVQLETDRSQRHSSQLGEDAKELMAHTTQRHETSSVSETALDIGIVVATLQEDIPTILRKQPHWSIFAEDFLVFDREAKVVFEGIPTIKMILRLLRASRKRFVVNQTIQLKSITGLEEPFDPFVMGSWHLQLAAEKSPLKFWQRREVVVDIQAKTVFHLNERSQVEYVMIDHLLVNGEEIQLSKLSLSDDLPSNINRMREWVSSHKFETKKASETSLQHFLLEASDGSLAFADYCNACGSSQYACLKGKARGRCNRTPWTVSEGCERGANCSNVLARTNALSSRSPSRSRGFPFGSLRRFVSSDCRGCLRECLGGPIAKAPIASMKILAPVGLLYRLAFKNRPIKTWPIQPILKELAKINPGFYGLAGAGVYMSCRSRCQVDCPYPGIPNDGKLPLDELDTVNPNDISFISSLYEQPHSRGELSEAFSDFFRIPGI